MTREIKKVKVRGGRYSLIRNRDGSGDSGMMLISIDPETGKQKGENGEVHLGCCIQCGSPFARSMQWQDWWLTTPVKKILRKTKNSSIIEIETANSTYTVKGF